MGLIPNLLIAPSRVERESGADRDDAHRERVFEILRFAHLTFRQCNRACASLPQRLDVRRERRKPVDHPYARARASPLKTNSGPADWNRLASCCATVMITRAASLRVLVMVRVCHATILPFPR